MAQFLRGKQAGVQRDLSAGLNAEIFLLDKVWSEPYSGAIVTFLGCTLWDQLPDIGFRL